MGFDFGSIANNLGKEFDKAIKDVTKNGSKLIDGTVKDVAKNSSDFIDGAAKLTSKVVETSSQVVKDTTKVLSKSVESDSSGLVAKTLIGATIGVCAVAAAPFTGGGSVVGGATLAASLTGAGTIAGATALGTAGAVGAAVVHGNDNISKEKQIKKAKAASFKDGINEGKSLSVKEIKKYADFCLATTALSYYFARCDGSISEEEMLEIDFDLDAIGKNKDIPKEIRNEIASISKDDTMTFNGVKKYLDKVSLETLKSLEKDIIEIVEADGVITKDEEIAVENYREYLRQREVGNK